MASSVENIIKNSRPEGFKGRIDRYLPKIGLGLKELILKVRDDLTYLGDEIDSNCVDHLAAMCILFGEDLHCRLGLWRAVEKWNVDVFNTPLPFLVPEGERDVELKKFDERRVQFFLWQVLTDYLDNEESTLNINPNHIELNLLAHTVAEFLANRFSPKLPQNSGIGRLLNLAHPEAPDLKRKLVWLGTQSYLFSSYAPPKDFQSVDEYKHWIELVDDYICQDCSRWSGMGPLEVLAGALQLDAQDKEDLMAWAYRLYAPYEVLSLTRKGDFVESIEALNLLNQQTYSVLIGTVFPAIEGETVLGALIPWRGHWFWSGTQRTMGTVENPRELQSIISQKNVEWVYRSCQDKLEMAHERALRHHNQFINFYGDDLKTFPNVKQLMSLEKKRLEAYNQQVAWANSEPGKEPKMKNFKFHNNMKKWKGSVAAFSDPVRGISYIPGFQYLHDGLTHSEDYTQEMWERFNQFMDDPTVPPSCVRRLTREFGLDSLLPHYQCRHQSKEMVQEFFLRCHKGKQFRKVFPNIAIV